MNKHEFEKTFWYFYLELEHDFLEIEKTIPGDCPISVSDS